MIDLDPGYLELIKHILAEHVPDCEARAFGSRVTGTSEPYSDLDIALIGGAILDWREIEALRDAFSESDLPIMVDVVDWNAASESFREIIDKQCEIIHKPSPHPSTSR